MDEKMEHTVSFPIKKEEEGVNEARRIILEVYQALKEKGYNPLNQMVAVSYTHLDVYKRQDLYLPAQGDNIFYFYPLHHCSCLLYTSRCV